MQRQGCDFLKSKPKSMLQQLNCTYLYGLTLHDLFCNVHCFAWSILFLLLKDTGKKLSWSLKCMPTRSLTAHSTQQVSTGNTDFQEYLCNWRVGTLFLNESWEISVQEEIQHLILGSSSLQNRERILLHTGGFSKICLQGWPAGRGRCSILRQHTGAQIIP